ncbi:MAG TPA: hypothetical protein VFT22_32655 [Kofleriaceae bacterium]|nr:hypothetical protein [Kofleriaceae bacterium]
MWASGVVHVTRAFADPTPAPKRVAYVGVHPIPAGDGGGFCQIEGPHVHVYLPVHPDELYRIVGGRYLFIGDPVPFGYDGPTHAYAGRHPIPVEHLVGGDHPEHDDAVFCYLDGPHYHIYAPPPGPAFVQRGNAYWYVGEWPRSYQLDGPRYQKINVIYAELTYTRPVLTVTAPPGYHVPVIEITAARPAAIVHAAPAVKLRARHRLVIDDDDDDDDDDAVYYYYYYRRPPHRHGHHHHHHGEPVIEPVIEIVR